MTPAIAPASATSAATVVTCAACLFARRPTAEQPEVARSLRHQPVGADQSEAAQAAGDQVGAVLVDRHPVRLRRVHPGETRHQPALGAQRDLILLAASTQRGQQGFGIDARTDVDEAAPVARAFERYRLGEAP